MDSGNGGLIGLLIVNVLGFLTIVVTTIATQMKASAERRQAAETLQITMNAQRDALLLAAQVESEKAERERKWAKEDREQVALKAATNHEAIASRIESVSKKADLVSKKADMAFAITTGLGLPDEPDMPKPVLSKRLLALAKAAQTPFPKLLDTQIGMPDFTVTDLFAHGQEISDTEPSEERIDVGLLSIELLPEKKK